MVVGSEQSSVLSVIFQEYEIVHQIYLGSAISLFAVLYRPILSDTDNFDLQEDVTAIIVSWIVNSLLSFQPAKCCYMVISRKRSSKVSYPAAV